MAEYIERSKVIELLKGTEVNGTPYMKRIVKATVDLAIEAISDDVPAADVEEVKHGQWVFDARTIVPRCSVCGEDAIAETVSPYCPNCGAKLNEEDENDQSND